MQIQKYTFPSFEGPTAKEVEQLALESLPPEPEEEPVIIEEPEPEVIMHSDEELENRYQQGVRDGYQKGINERDLEQEALNKKIDETLNTIGINIAISISQFLEANQLRSRDLANAALAIARKIAGTALKEDPLTEVSAVAEKVVSMLYTEPRLDITVHPSLTDALHARLNVLLHDKGFKGEFFVRGLESMAETDCRIEWQDGVAESNKQSMQDEIAAIIEKIKN